MAQRAGIPELVIGSDFSAFMGSPRWDGLDASLRRTYHGTLTFANWWDRQRFSGDGGHEVREAVDAYPPTGVHFYADWRVYDRSLPPTTIETGVGIAAAPKAYLEPWRENGRSPIPTAGPGPVVLCCLPGRGPQPPGRHRLLAGCS